ncbi:MAG: F0F1 ATP synthase subunit delta [Propionibacteriaceae bacterium]|nr:F0F1 ATP synthase subunit delta [Propionibacteriaceae bacterium]
MTAQMPATAQVAHDLNQVLRTLREHPALARALTDPSATAQARGKLIDSAFASLSTEARGELKVAMTMNWESNRAFLAWVENTAVRAAWTWAAEAGVLRRAIDEVFAFGRLVYTDHEARASITDRRVSVERRQELVKTLLSPTMAAPSVEVAMAAVSSRQGTIDDAVHTYVEIGTELAGGRLAVVTVAKALPSDQKDRIREALEAHLGTQIIIQEIVDPQVLGGVRVECGAEVIDSTLAARLESARRDFA